MTNTIDSFYLAEALANALGWPAWATLDEVVEAATALGWCSAEGDLEDRAREALRAVAARERESASADVKSAEDARPCDGWSLIARASWIAAGEALARRDYRAMREHAARAKEAEERANLVIAAIFGVVAPDPAAVAAAKRRLASMPADAADTCRRAVVAEMKAHAERVRRERARPRSEAAARRAAREAEAREAARREKELREAELKKAVDVLNQHIGKVVTCRSDPYYGSVVASVPGVGDVDAYTRDRAFGTFRARVVSVGTYDGRPYVVVQPEV